MGRGSPEGSAPAAVLALPGGKQGLPRPRRLQWTSERAATLWASPDPGPGAGSCGAPRRQVVMYLGLPRCGSCSGVGRAEPGSAGESRGGGEEGVGGGVLRNARRSSCAQERSSEGGVRERWQHNPRLSICWKASWELLTLWMTCSYVTELTGGVRWHSSLKIFILPRARGNGWA